MPNPSVRTAPARTIVLIPQKLALLNEATERQIFPLHLNGVQFPELIGRFNRGMSTLQTHIERAKVKLGQAKNTDIARVLITGLNQKWLTSELANPSTNISLSARPGDESSTIDCLLLKACGYKDELAAHLVKGAPLKVTGFQSRLERFKERLDKKPSSTYQAILQALALGLISPEQAEQRFQEAQQAIDELPAELKLRLLAKPSTKIELALRAFKETGQLVLL